MKHSLKNRIARQLPLVGTLATLPLPEIAEILSSAGFDWLFVDLEHSALGIKDAQTLLQEENPQVERMRYTRAVK